MGGVAMSATPQTPARELRMAYIVGVCFEFSVLGAFYTFPLWIVHFKKLYTLEEVVVNVVGSLLYLASMLSFPFVVAIKSAARRHMSVQRRQLLLYALSPTCAMFGYLVLWWTTVTYHGERYKNLAAALLCAGAFLIRCDKRAATTDEQR